MNKNKGIISIGLIIAIVLGVVIIGGGAYYLGKSSSNQTVNNPVNYLPTNQDQNSQPVKQNQPTVDNSQQNKVPSITVLSPNGGENYMAGDKITVKWTSKGLPKDTPVQILLITKTGPWNSSPSSNFDLSNDNSILASSGSATFTIPDINSNKWTGSKDIRFGNYYKIYISQNLDDSIDASDYSDNLFTINSPKTISTALPAKYLSSQNWPPVVKTSGFAYSCKVSSGTGDVPTVVEEKIINGKKYCVTSYIDAGAGSRFGEYTYTTASTSGSGTKTTSFNLRWSSCGGYDQPEAGQCQAAVSTFLNNLDVIVDSLM